MPHGGRIADSQVDRFRIAGFVPDPAILNFLEIIECQKAIRCAGDGLAQTEARKKGENCGWPTPPAWAPTESKMRSRTGKLSL